MRRSFLALIGCVAVLPRSLPAETASPPASTTVWDFIVVGAGTGGAVCAARLAEAGAEVLLLEAGIWDGEWLYDLGKSRDRNSEPYVWAYPTELPGKLQVHNSPGMRTRVAAGKLMGGSSSVHGDVYDRPPVREFEYSGLKSWDGRRVQAAFESIEEKLTISWKGEDDLDAVPDPQFYVIDKLMKNMPVEYHPRGNLDGRKGGLATGWSMYRSCSSLEEASVLGVHGGQRCKRHTSYSDLVPPRNGSREGVDDEGPRITVLAHALVARVLLQAGEAVGVEVLRHGRRHEALARRAVILAAGAIGTPKILTLSGIGDPFDLQRLEIPVQVANREVGQGLADHLAMFTWFMISGSDVLKLEGDACIDNEKFNVFFNLTGPPADGDGPVDAEVRFFSGCNLTRKTVDFGVEAVLLHPESRGRVVVNSADPEVMPLVEYPPLWQRDYERLEAIYARLAECLDMRPEDFSNHRGRSLAQTVRDEAYLYQHFCCTARAAPSGEPGVCDENLGVRGVQGLYVADAAALPFTPSSHTSAPVLLMGELAAASALADTSSRRHVELRAGLAEQSQEAKDAARSVLLAAGAATADAFVVPTLPLHGPAVSGRGVSKKPSVDLPMLGLGTGTLKGPKIIDAVATFLRLGGRHLDTAVMYDNYAQIRSGIVASGIQNSSAVSFTWKVMPFGGDYVRSALHSALDVLGVSHIDLAMLHWPGDITAGKLLHGKALPTCVEVRQDPETGMDVHYWHRCRQESYAALVDECSAGRVRTVGVSNFAARHLDELLQDGHAPPAVHQLELHPLWHDDALLARHEREGTKLQAYGCLGGAHTGASLLLQEGFRKIAARRGVTPAQVLLRWATQRGASVISGGSSRTHLAENLQIFKFELSGDEMDFMDSMAPESMTKMYGPRPEEIL